MNKKYKPGEIPLTPGKYSEVGPHGETLQKKKKITNGPGKEKLPPTTKKKNKWVKIYN